MREMKARGAFLHVPPARKHLKSFIRGSICALLPYCAVVAESRRVAVAAAGVKLRSHFVVAHVVHSVNSARVAAR
jgi:hypothetical protein